MENIIFSTLVLGFGIAVHRVVLLNHDTRFERALLNRSFGAHLAAGVLLLILYNFYFAGGDLNAYYYFGAPIADALRSDFGSVFPHVWALFVHADYQGPFEIFGTGSTGSMQAIAIALLFVLGNSQLAATLAICVGSYVSKVFVYRALKPEFPATEHERVLTALMLSPSGVIWTCGLLKEPVLMLALGPAFLALRWLVEGRRLVLAIALLAGCGWIMVLIKPYVLIAFFLAGATWLIWARLVVGRGLQAVRPFYLAAAAVGVIVGFSVVSAVVPSLSPDRLAESAQYQRRVSAREYGGSNFYLENPDSPVDESPGPVGQLALVPMALVTALFRPFIFESFTVMQFLNALEMTWILYLAVQVFRAQSWRGVLSRVTANPALMLCAVFTLIIALGTGLASANLGTLSRYRAPMMPFFLCLLLILRKREAPAAPTLNGGLHAG